MTRRIYVASFAPSYDEGATGGHEWRSTRTSALLALAHLGADPESDLRFTVLDMPEGMTDDEIEDFLASGPGSELIDPPDPRQDLTDALECWRENARELDALPQGSLGPGGLCPRCRGELSRPLARAIDPRPMPWSCGACGFGGAK